MNTNDNIVNKYDRQRGSLEGVARFTKPSTVKTVEQITGRAETFIVESARHDELGTFVFIEALDAAGVVRLALPPKVVAANSRQQDALTAKSRSIAAKTLAQARKDRGEVPGFMRAKRAWQNRW
jgi:hypothetical protein